MKFTKLTSAALTGATLLSIFAPATTTFAKTAEHDAKANGGTELPQNDYTKAGISFGDNKPNPNTGFLRLQMVPHVLDFGNHAKFDTQYTEFTADGKNYANESNDREASYENSKANQTAVLSTDDLALKGQNGEVWATVVDKQVTRDQVKDDNDNTQHSGDWTLSVQADGNGLKAKNGSALTGAQLMFKNTNYGETDAVYHLTNEDQDATFVKDVESAYAASTAKDKDTQFKTTKVSTINKTINLNLDDAKTSVQVAKAATDEGLGADVFGWKPEDVQLYLQGNSQVNNAIYTANLTWTLATGK